MPTHCQFDSILIFYIDYCNSRGIGNPKAVSGITRAWVPNPLGVPDFSLFPYLCSRSSVPGQ